MQDPEPPLRFYGIDPPDPLGLNTMNPSVAGVPLANLRECVVEVFEGSKPPDTQASRRPKLEKSDWSGLGAGQRHPGRIVREEVGPEDV